MESAKREKFLKCSEEFKVADCYLGPDPSNTYAHE